jgi:hypothetical protein
MATYGDRPGRPTYRPTITYRARTSIRFLLHARAIILQAIYLQRIKSIPG